MITIIVMAFALMATNSVVQAQAVPAPKTDALQNQLNEIAASFPGKIGAYVRNVETGATAGIKPDDVYPMASTYKIAIMLQVFLDSEAGKLSLTDRVTLKENDQRLGSGQFQYFTPGLSPTIHDLLLLMITVSDNVATDILLNRVGATNVTATLQKLGIKNFRVDRTTEQIISDWLSAADPQFRGKKVAEIMAHPEIFAKLTKEQMDHAGQTLTDDPRDHASPRAMAELLEKIVKSQAASDKSCKDMLEIMTHQEHRSRISRFMGEMTTATKSGTIGATTNDVGVLFVGNQHVIVTVFTLKANSLVQTDQAEEVIGRIAKTTYDYFLASGSSH